MKYFIIPLLMLSCKSSQRINKLRPYKLMEFKSADSFVVQKLLYFDSLINGNKIDPKFHTMLGQRIEANTLYMEKLTKINSTGQADHYGRKNVSITTYTEWVKWYLQNKENLLWDDEKKEAFFR